jgi:hypothetical protein
MEASVAKTREQEIIALETSYWEAIRDRDAGAAMALTDDRCIVAGAQGAALLERAQFEGMLSSSDWTLHEFEISNPVVQFAGDQVAIIAYDVTEELTVEGELLSLRAADASTWIRREGGWMCALHTESIRGDAFGRDRTPA